MRSQRALRTDNAGQKKGRGEKTRQDKEHNPTNPGTINTRILPPHFQAHTKKPISTTHFLRSILPIPKYHNLQTSKTQTRGILASEPFHQELVCEISRRIPLPHSSHHFSSTAEIRRLQFFRERLMGAGENTHFIKCSSERKLFETIAFTAHIFEILIHVREMEYTNPSSMMAIRVFVRYTIDEVIGR